jgi:hypothetical protein
MSQMTQSALDWEVGYSAAIAGGACMPPREVQDLRSFKAGFIVGTIEQARAWAIASHDNAADRPADGPPA